MPSSRYPTIVRIIREYRSVQETEILKSVVALFLARYLKLFFSKLLLLFFMTLY
jgi:hypothetical protein